METTIKEQLIQKLKEKSTKVAVIGIGYVGLPLLVTFAEAGFHVVGIDSDQRKVGMVNRGESYILDITDQQLAPLV
ncbi:MAG: UDP-N-acetyl-D-glucosamine dehydrogenase, partial [Anaerolineaceae bacterium]|nr:UDP-N-acetyl-D-glucosamine dehydrogenase [Anaerolineaceae bacterium]